MVVAAPIRSPHDCYARAFAQEGTLRLHLLGTRRGSDGVPAECTRLNPIIGALEYAAMKYLPIPWREGTRYAIDPLFDLWARRHLRQGDALISSYGYANACFRWVRKHHGVAILDSGMSHPKNFWDLMTAEHKRWKCPTPALPAVFYRRALEMAEQADFVLCLSRFVRDSFVEQGFPEERLGIIPRPLDLSIFRRPKAPRPPGRKFRIISTGGVNLRKGTPYLLQAFERLLARSPDYELTLIRSVHPSMAPVLRAFADLPVNWVDPVPPRALADLLRDSDLFVLPSIEDGFARTVAEAIACGLPVLTTPNTGASDVIEPGINGDLVAPADAEAITGAVTAWESKLRSGYSLPAGTVETRLSWETFRANLAGILRQWGLRPE